MLLLNQNAIALISGGFNDVIFDLTVRVPSEDISYINWLVFQLLTGQLNANVMANTMTLFPDGFNEMEVLAFKLYVN